MPEPLGTRVSGEVIKKYDIIDIYQYITCILKILHKITHKRVSNRSEKYFLCSIERF